MTTVAVLEAVAHLQPRISTSSIAPEVAMASWTAIKNFPDMVYPFMQTSFFWATGSTAFLGLSIITTLALARIPSSQKSPASDSPNRWDWGTVAASSFCMFYALFKSVCLFINLGASNLCFVEKIPQSITHLNPSLAAPAELVVVGWAILKHSVTNFSCFNLCMQRSFMWTTVNISIAFATTFIALKSQNPNEESTQTKNRLNNITLGCLSLAAITSLCGYIYTKTYAPILS
ncbi:MAG TPA: hypothetical protein VFU89_03350 [Rhabdochlamydiaceae bacterium]|nr:hypothetical protein [Rhabdochlamydiaceae bacterium]